MLLVSRDQWGNRDGGAKIGARSVKAFAVKRTIDRLGCRSAWRAVRPSLTGYQRKQSQFPCGSFAPIHALLGEIVNSRYRTFVSCNG